MTGGVSTSRWGFRLARAMEPGAALGLWTPSSPAPALFPRRYQRAVQAIRSAGIDVVTTETTTGNVGVGVGVGAAHPANLAADLHKLITDERIGAVLCTTGGYTSATVLRYIDWTLVRETAVPVIGYSDITAVLWSLLSQAKLMSFHGPMLVSEWGEWGGPWEYTVDNFRRALNPQLASAPLQAPGVWTDETLWWDEEDTRRRRTQSGGWRCLVPGRAEGWLLPGCAASATHLFGTPYMPGVDGAVLCLEFHTMGPDEVWAHLVQWENSGLLDRISGLVIGRHAGPRAAAGGSRDFDAVVRQAVGDRGFPVLVDVDFGHTEPMLTLPVGCHAMLDATACQLTLLEPATATITRRKP
jgi:muramoyltetrapeptide carboxypeptidase